MQAMPSLPSDDQKERELNSLRRAWDKHQVGRLEHLETKLDQLEARVDAELRDLDKRLTANWQDQREGVAALSANVERILARQSEQAPMMESMQRIVQSGFVLRWILVSVVGLLAAVGTTATAWDILKGIFR